MQTHTRPVSALVTGERTGLLEAVGKRHSTHLHLHGAQIRTPRWPGIPQQIHRRPGRAQGTRARLIRAIAKVDLLLIDDFGLKPLRAPADEDLHEIIDERYERKATIVTSNLDLDEWPQAFASNQLIAVATIDRLKHRAWKLTLQGKSWRALRALDATQSTPSKPSKTAQKPTPLTA